MAASQKIVFTVMPRGVSLGGGSLPLSVLVSPRLYGETSLGAFADWEHWTQRLGDEGLELELRCGGNSQSVAIDPGPLRADIWEALFRGDTLVRPYVFDDYSARAVLSYSVRDTLGALKSIYQQAALTLALPGPSGPHQREDRNRSTLRSLLDGLAVHWSEAEGERLRQMMRDSQPRGLYGDIFLRAEELDAEGLPTGPPGSGRNASVALPFSVFHHMPTPPRDVPLAPDYEKLLDFHQALASLNAYRPLQRALGIVFDVELPQDFVPVGAGSTSSRVSVGAVTPGWEWAVPTETRSFETECVHVETDATTRVFFAAPRAYVSTGFGAVLGLLDLEPERFGVAQVDVDGAMHKAILLAETWSGGGGARNADPYAQPEAAAHPEVFDPEATLPSLRSGGVSVFADHRALQLLATITGSKQRNDAVENGGGPHPLFAEDLVRGYRLDIWDSRTDAWHSLHLRRGTYAVEDVVYEPGKEEGFVQLAVMQPAPGAVPVTTDLYLHEAIARWAGWSLSVPLPAKPLLKPGGPDTLPADGEDIVETPTPFKLTTSYSVLEGSLPLLRFGVRYRIRARAVDLAGNSLELDDPIADRLASFMALPRDPEGFAYLRYEPVPAPIVVIRDKRAVTGAGSAVDRLVIRTFNDEIGKDTDPADTTAGDRHLLPPRASVELGERLGMFDDAAGKLKSDLATWTLIGDRDAGELPSVPITVGGPEQEHPLEAGATVAKLPYLPDPLSRGVALRDLPGTPGGSLGHAGAAAGPIAHRPLDDPSPRAGSATIVEFPDADAWEKVTGIRFELREPAAGAVSGPTSWDPAGRVLTVHLAKGEMTTVPLTSWVRPSDLSLLGQWQWLRELVDETARTKPELEQLRADLGTDLIDHVLQRAVEGGHWLLTPPRLLTLVHAVQQPLGRPAFTAIGLEFDSSRAGSEPLETGPSSGRSDPTELAPITSYRRPGSTDAFLIGALKVHGASTAHVDLKAEWVDPVDDGAAPSTVNHSGPVDELSLSQTVESYLYAPSGKDTRAVGWYDPEHDQIAFVRAGERAPASGAYPLGFTDAAPRHALGDTRHHQITYTAVATSRYREYYDAGLDAEKFTRAAAPVVVDVPASAPPLAPDVLYAIPTFGWQRQKGTNVMRSVRFGGGLRVYLKRPWFSSGRGELLGVTLWSERNGGLDSAARDRFKPYITQWGMDPIWLTADVGGAPSVGSFPDKVAYDYGVPLEHAPGVVDVVGFEPQYNEDRNLWFADLTVNMPTETYMPFVRLALVRYQPHALRGAKVSRAVLSDFAQLTPDRTATATYDPHHPRRLNVTVSGVAPRGPQRTRVVVRVQSCDPAIGTDLGWQDVPESEARVTDTSATPPLPPPDITRWTGSVEFASDPSHRRYRLLIEEHEELPTYRDHRPASGPRRLVYAETFELGHTS
jgi:hypothetical protein